jgi:hypothetical protein
MQSESVRGNRNWLLAISLVLGVVGFFLLLHSQSLPCSAAFGPYLLPFLLCLVGAVVGIIGLVRIFRSSVARKRALMVVSFSAGLLALLPPSFVLWTMVDNIVTFGLLCY